METRDLPLDLLDPPLVIERRTLDTDAFRELVTSIREKGVLQAIIVRPIDGRYRVVAGWRRTEAARTAGLVLIPAQVREMDDAEELTLRDTENAKRENPNPVEEGALFAAMQEGLGLTTQAIAERVNRSYAVVAGRLELVRGPENVREAVHDGSINLSVALGLLRCDHPGDRDNLLYHARRGGCTAALMQSWVRQAAEQRAAQPRDVDPRAAVVSLERPPIPQGLCEWHEGPVVLDALLSIRVCTVCYQALVALREFQKGQDQQPAKEGPYVDGQGHDAEPAGRLLPGGG